MCWLYDPFSFLGIKILISEWKCSISLSGSSSVVYFEVQIQEILWKEFNLKKKQKQKNQDLFAAIAKLVKILSTIFNFFLNRRSLSFYFYIFPSSWISHVSIGCVNQNARCWHYSLNHIRLLRDEHECFKYRPQSLTHCLPYERILDILREKKTPAFEIL